MVLANISERAHAPRTTCQLRCRQWDRVIHETRPQEQRVIWSGHIDEAERWGGIRARTTRAHEKCLECKESGASAAADIWMGGEKKNEVILED